MAKQEHNPTTEQIKLATQQVDIERLADRIAVLMAEDLRLAELRNGPVRPMKARRQ